MTMNTGREASSREKTSRRCPAPRLCSSYHTSAPAPRSAAARVSQNPLSGELWLTKMRICPIALFPIRTGCKHALGHYTGWLGLLASNNEATAVRAVHPRRCGCLGEQVQRGYATDACLMAGK